MKNKLSAIFFLILFVFSALGQKNEMRKLDRSAATTAWSQAMSLPSDTPAISAGGLVVESETNGFGRRVWLVATQSGTYLLQGKTCSDEYVKLGELGWESSPNNPTMTVQIFDSAALGAALPFFQLCTIEAIRLDKGKIERLAVDTNSWQPSSATRVQVSESLLDDGRYQVSTSLPADGSATAILSRYAFGKVESTLFGSVITFPAGNLPAMGLTTLTVCQKGGCVTTTFERRLEVPYAGGKG